MAHRHAASSGPAAGLGTPRPRGDLAPLTVIYVGPIGEVASLTPRVDAEQLEQDIVVRKVERDVEELERLRQEDEKRARQEAERQRAIDAERQQQQPAAPAPGWKTGVDRSDVPPAVLPPASIQTPPAYATLPQPPAATPQDRRLPAAETATPIPAPPMTVDAATPVQQAPRPAQRTTPRRPPRAIFDDVGANRP